MGGRPQPSSANKARQGKATPRPGQAGHEPWGSWIETGQLCEGAILVLVWTHPSIGSLVINDGASVEVEKGKNWKGGWKDAGGGCGTGNVAVRKAKSRGWMKGDTVG